MLLFLCEVELEKAETTSTSRSIRTTCAKSFALLRSSDSFLSAFSRILIFSSLVIQESLINFAEIIRSANDLKFNKSKKSSHCELFFVFCLSA